MEFPDLSHLTKEEQDTILKVIQRQQDEEAKEKAMMKTLQEQFENYKLQVKKAETAALELKQSPEEIKDLCALCHKTKIAEGCGHSCSYCSVTFCSRCGGRVAVKSDKNKRMITWVCALCRKQHDILKKTGAWYRTEQNRSNFSLRLEPMPKNDVGKITASMSLAQLETNAQAKNKMKSGYSPKLRKGSSEPQLTNCEKSTDIPSNQLQQSKHINGSNAIASEKETEDRNREDLHSKGPSSLKHESQRSATPSEKKPVHQKQTTEQKQGASSNFENFTENYRVENHKSTEQNASSPKVAGERLSYHSHRYEQEKSKSSKLSCNGGVNRSLPYNEAHQEAKLNPSSICHSNPDVESDYQSDLSSRSRKFNTFVDGPHTQSGHPQNNTVNYESSSLSASAVSATNSVANPSNNRKITQSDVEDLAYAQKKQQRSFRDGANTERRIPHQNTTEVDSKPYRSNGSHHRSHSPSSSRSSPQILHSPVPGHRRCRRSSPVLSHRELHDALVNHRRYDEARVHHHQGQHRSHSPSRKEIRKCTRHPPRRKDCLSDNDGAEYTERLHQPSRRHHRSSSSCLGESSSHVEDLCYGKDNTFHPSMVVFDDVPPHVSDSPCKRDCCAHSHNATRNSKYHSDLNLSRLSCNYSSEGAVSSSSHASHGVHCAQNRRRNPSKHGTDYQLQLSHLRKHQRQKSRTGKHLRRKTSLSSTDDEMQSTPDYSSCDESDKKVGTGLYRGGNPSMFISTESGYYSSHVNQNKDKNQPVDWRPSADGKCLLGRMVLNKGGGKPAKDSKEEPPSGVLGVKVVGGKANRAGGLSAYVSMVKKGSVADTVGNLKKGDEVIMWNSFRLQGASYEEVCKAILDSKGDKTVSLVVCRPIEDTPRIPDARWRHPVTESSSSSFDSSQKREDDLIVATGATTQHASHRLEDEPSTRRRSDASPGKLQVRIWYDRATQQLYVTVLQAVELPVRSGGMMRNPYVKLYLLPDRSELSKRRTKTARKTTNPIWNQSFLYGGLRKQDLGSMSLELTLWDLDRSVETNGHFLGEVLIDLGLARVDDVPQWYKLMPAGEGMNQSFDPTAMPRYLAGPSAPLGKAGHGSHQKRHLGHRDCQEGNALNRHHRETVSEANFSSLPVDHPHATAKSFFYHGSLPSSSHYLTHDESSMSPRSRTKHLSNESSPVLRSSRSRGGHQVPDRISQSSSTFNQMNNGDESCRVLPSIQHNRQNASPRQAHHNSDPRSKSSKELDQSSDVTNRNSSSIHSSIATPVNAERTRRLSVDNVKSGSSLGSTRSAMDDTLSKSVSLSANLYAQNKSRTLGSKSAESSNQTSPHSKNSSPSVGKSSGNTFFAQKLLVGLKNRSQSSSTLEGSRQKGVASSTRCSEFGVHPNLQRDGSRESASGSIQSLASEGSGRSVDRTLKDFVDGLGVGQVAGRQTLATSSLGKIQLSICDAGSGVRVEVRRAEGLVLKPGAKTPPAVHVKVYLMFEKQCIAKRKTKAIMKSRSPEFRQSVHFEPNQYGNSIQVVVWGDYGRLDSKSFMGMAQIKILTGDHHSKQEGWYTLFPTSSLLETSLLDNLTGSKTSLENDSSNFRS